MALVACKGEMWREKSCVCVTVSVVLVLRTGMSSRCKHF